jgi:hypothetical protein
MQAGWIETPGNGISNPVAIDNNNPLVRIYRIRRDWNTVSQSDLTKEAAELFNILEQDVTETQIQLILDKYKSDWKEWPVNLGAPYYDVNNNGIYDPILDENNMPTPRIGDYPGLQNADQVIWYVMNDLNPTYTYSFYGSPPIGLEVQVTVWSYKQPNSILGQTIFKRYKIYNFSGFDIDSMYVSQWVDPDIGNYADDLCGYDEELELAFAYNGEENDIEFQALELPPPAVGYILIQGPIIPSLGDTAIYNYKKLSNFKNSRISSFGYFREGSAWSDPELGAYDGTFQWYNLLRGYAPTTNVENPTRWTHTTGESIGVKTYFPLNGDPVTGTGDIDGITCPPGARRFCLNCGPFDLQNGDNQEIIIAVIAGLGTNNLTSLTELKENVRIIRSLYVLTSISYEEKIIPTEIFLYQNYPNPFNSSTTISYSIGAIRESPLQQVNLSIYNILGQKVVTLVNKKQPAGNYSVEWDASGFVSGVYFYRLTTDNGFVQSRKLLLLK